MYVLNNPLKYIDPSGYITESETDLEHVISNLLGRPGSSWSPDGGYRYVQDDIGDGTSGWFNSNMGGAGGFMRPIYGGGGFSGSLFGKFTRVYKPNKGRYGFIYQHDGFQITLPSIIGYEWVPDSPGTESSIFTPLEPTPWLSESIDNIYPGRNDSSTRSGGTEYSGPVPPGGYTSFENKSGKLSQWNPSGVHRWSRSSNFFAQLSYNLVDGVSVTAQSFFRGPNSVHLTGELVIGDDRVDAFVNTASWALVAGEASTFQSIQGGFYSSRWGLRLQAHTHSISPLKGTGATGTMSPFHFNINSFHIIPNPKYWRYYYRIF